MPTDQQAVTATTDGKAKLSTEAKADARDGADDLDNLLKEYETDTSATTQPDKGSETKPAKTEQKSESAPELLALVRQIDERDRAREETAERQRFDIAMKKTIESIRGDTDSEIVTDGMVKGWIDEQAVADPRLIQEWKDRDKDPKRFQKVVDGLAKRFSNRRKLQVDAAATEDREAVTAAVRGASTKAPEEKAPDVKNMTDAELRAHSIKTYGYAPKI